MFKSSQRNVTHWIWVALTVTLVLCGSVQAGPDTASLYKAMGQKRLKDVYNRAQQLKSRYPNDHRLWYIQGQAFFWAGQKKEAHTYFSKAIDLGRQSGDVFFFRAMTGMSQSRPDRVLEDINRAIADRTTADQLTEQDRKKGYPANREIRQDYYARFFYLRATTLHSDFQRYDQALADINRAISSVVKPVPGHYRERGDIYYLKKEFGRAYEDYRQAVGLDPGMITAWTAMGQAALYQGQYQEAVRCLEKAIDLDPEYSGAARDLGLAYAMAGNSTKALANMGLAINKAPDADNYYHLAYFHHINGNKTQAKKNYQKATDLDPDILKTREHWVNIVPFSSPVKPFFEKELFVARSYLEPGTGTGEAGIRITEFKVYPAPVSKGAPFKIIVGFLCDFPGMGDRIPTKFAFTISQGGQELFSSQSRIIQAPNGEQTQWTHQMNPVPVIGLFSMTASLSRGNTIVRKTINFEIR